MKYISVYCEGRQIEHAVRFFNEVESYLTEKS